MNQKVSVSAVHGNSLSVEMLKNMDAWWRAANYLSVGQIYLRDNPLLREPLTLEHVKSRLLGHWGTTPGLKFIYVHMNRLIMSHDLNVIYITGQITAARVWLPTPGWKAPTATSTTMFRKPRWCAQIIPAVYPKQWMRDKHIEHQRYITEHGVDMLMVTQWV